MDCWFCLELISSGDRYCSYCGQAQVQPVLAVCEVVAESVRQEGAPTVRAADALISEYVMRFRARGLVEGYPAETAWPYSVGEATDLLYQAARNVVKAGFNPLLVARVGARVAGGVFYERAKRLQAATDGDQARRA